MGLRGGVFDHERGRSGLWHAPRASQRWAVLWERELGALLQQADLGVIAMKPMAAAYQERLGSSPPGAQGLDPENGQSPQDLRPPSTQSSEVDEEALARLAARDRVRVLVVPDIIEEGDLSEGSLKVHAQATPANRQRAMRDLARAILLRKVERVLSN